MTVEEIQGPASGTFTGDFYDAYYKGILPAGGPFAAIPPTLEPSNAANRVGSVSFSEPGIYLVIGNVRGQLLEGMYAGVKAQGGAPLSPAP